jgi:hypothetical protein
MMSGESAVDSLKERPRLQLIDPLHLKVCSTGVRYGPCEQVRRGASACITTPCTSGLFRLSILGPSIWIVQQITRSAPFFRIDADVCGAEAYFELVSGVHFFLGSSQNATEQVLNEGLKVMLRARFVGHLPRQISWYILPFIEAGLIEVTGVAVEESCIGHDEAKHKRPSRPCSDPQFDESSQNKTVEIHAKPRSRENLIDFLSLICPELCAAAARAQQCRRTTIDTLISRLITAIEVTKNASDQGLNIFSAHEQHILDKFCESTKPAKYLVVRLLQRRARRTRMSSMKMYLKRRNMPCAIDELIDCGLAFGSTCVSRNCTTDDIKEICETLACDELKQVATKFRKSLPKGGMIDTITDAYADSSVRNGHCSFTKSLYKINSVIREETELKVISDIIGLAPPLEHALHSMLCFLFLQDSGLDCLMLEDIGLTYFPQFDIPVENAASALCTSQFYGTSVRKQRVLMTTCENSFCTSGPAFTAFTAVSEKSNVLDFACDAGDDFAVVRILSHDFFPLVFSTRYLHLFRQVFYPNSSCVVNAVVTYISLLEKRGYYDNATAVLVKSIFSVVHPEKQSLWLVHTSSSLSRQHGRVRDALGLCLHALRNQWLRCEEKMGLQQRSRWLARQCNQVSQLCESLFVDAGWIFRVDHIHAYVLNANAHQKKRYVSVTPGIGHVSSTVEDLALLHYADDDLGNWRGVHAESRFWTMIFSLLFADIIFMPVVGAFHSPFQSKPFDLNTADFTSVRRCAINQRMASIRRGDSRPIITRSWSAHFDKKIPGVFWHLLRIEDICDILDGLGGLALSYMMKLLADDYGAWSIGAPDLLLWKKTNDFPAMVKFVEVKSSNDHLTEQQQAWFTALHDAGVDVAICKVSS